MQEVTDGLMQPWEYRAKWRGESMEQAKAAIAGDAADDATLLGFPQNT